MESAVVVIRTPAFLSVFKGSYWISRPTPAGYDHPPG